MHSLLQRWIKKKNYRQKHVKPMRAPILKKKKVTPWQHFMADFGKTQGCVLHCTYIHAGALFQLPMFHTEGKDTISKDFVEFSRAASAAYKQLPLAEREALKLRSTEQTVTLNAAATRREGNKTFREIQKLVRSIHTIMLLLTFTCSLYIQRTFVDLGRCICLLPTARVVHYYSDVPLMEWFRVHTSMGTFGTLNPWVSGYLWNPWPIHQ